MGTPKRKQSHSRKHKRLMANRFRAGQTSKCPQCGSAVLPHRVCGSCGYYGSGKKSRQVISVEAA